MKDSPRNRVSRHFLRAAPRQRPRLATSLGAAALFFGAAAALGGDFSQKGASAPRTPPDPTGARRILLIAGPITGHPKEAHEYEKSVVLFKRLLETSPNLRGARVEIHLGGWPADPSSLDSADTIVLISDGGDHNETDHPLYVGDRLAALERSMRRGCGLVNLHWSTFHPARFHDRITEWLGGYFDYETGGGEPKWYSRIQHANWRVAPIAPAEGGAELHPILRGVRPFEMREEFYFRLRFRESDARLRPILAIAPTEPPGATITAGPQNENVVAWARERPDGGRAFGCTGGHYFANWWNPDFRKVILNAIAWTAKLDVPAEGVASEPFERFRALVVTGHNHPAHDWRAVTAALVQVLEADPRMQVDVTEQPNDLATIDLGAYALLVLNYCNWDRPGLSHPAQQALVRRLESGGGLAVVHFANGAFNSTLPAKDSDWEEFRTNIVRRVWMHGDGRSGHDAFGPFRVEIARANHEVTARLPGFDTVDELYFRQEGSQPIEVLATAKSKVTGMDEPMAWVHAYGRGRVFQTVLGHSDVSVRKAGDLMRRGAIWAAGRPPLGFDPPMAAAETYLFREGSPWSPAESKAREGARGANEAARTAPPALLAASPGLEAGLGGHWGVQSDKDWVDARWSQTDVGPFLASSIEVPGGFVTKALAIRVGDGGGGAVCFDTQSVGLRAAWTGTFLELPRVRFGITEKPRIAGKIVISTPPGAGWTVDGAPPSSSTVRYTGLHRHGRRVVLSCDVGGVELLESPWLETRGSIFAFRRSVEAASGSTALQCLVASLQGAAGQASPDGDGTTAILELGEAVTVVHATPREALTLRVRGEAIEAVLPARTAPRAGTIWLGSGPRASVEPFLELARAPRPPEDLHALSRPDPEPSTTPLTTRGQLGTGPGPYVIDTLTLPYENPARALLFLSGLDFFANGDAAVCSVHGDVWTVSGIDDRLDHLVWRRFATGLYQPLGLKIVLDRIHVIGRDQITRLEDEDGDGVADFYGCFSNVFETSSGRHDFSTCLETDSDGSFYFVSPKGLHRIAQDGHQAEVIATGWRNPNGMSIGPSGEITVAPQEGEWTPASAIFLAQPGGYYGFGGPRTEATRPLGYDPPLCWLPRPIDNSTGGQVWVEGKRWGPLEGQLLSLSFGRSSHMLVLRDTASPVPQGGAVPLKGRFLSGAHRGRFRPADGQLYVAGQMGWVTNAVADGCLQRVRYTGGPVRLPVGFRAHSNGLLLELSERLDPAAAQDVTNYSLEQWNYKYAASYGSEDYSARHPDAVGHDPVAIASATLLGDGKEVFLEVPGLRPVLQMHLRASLRAADGADFAFDFYPTLNALGPRREVDGATDDVAALVPPPVEVAAPPGRGLIQTLSGPDGAPADVRVVRLAALRVPVGEPPSAFLDPGPFRSVWEGFLRIEEGGRFRFSVSGRGSFRLSLDGALAAKGNGEELSRFESGWLRLARGNHRIRLEYDAPSSGDAWARLYWTGLAFAREAVPPTAFRNDPSDASSDAPSLARFERLRAGFALLEEAQCARCHAAPEKALPEVSGAGTSLAAPILDGVGDRLRENWLAKWVEQPRSLRKAAVMPALPASAGGREARDIAAYLASLHRTSASGDREAAGSATNASTSGSEPPRGDAQEGAKLFATIGCTACHIAPAAEPKIDAARLDGERIALRHVAEEWTEEGLVEFLLRPSGWRPSTRMPDFGLAFREARHLATFLLDGGAKPEIAAVVTASGDARRGEELFSSLGCAACHPISGGGKASPARSLEQIFDVDWTLAGCAGAKPGRGPRYELNAEESAALREVQLYGLAPLSRRDAAELSRRSVRELRCGACHDRDGVESLAARLERAGERGAPELSPPPGEDDAGNEDSSPLPAALKFRPSLTFAGEQLRTDWLQKLFAGRLGYRVRPWLPTRMPAFPSRADALAKGLALEHGCAPAVSEEPSPDAEAVNLGRKLIGTAGGFSCTACHPVGDQPAQMQLHFGVVNLKHSRERLRREHYLRWMLNPQRLQPSSPMPAYTDEDGRSALASILGGDGERQFEAIWECLR